MRFDRVEQFFGVKFGVFAKRYGATGIRHSKAEKAAVPCINGAAGMTQAPLFAGLGRALWTTSIAPSSGCQPDGGTAIGSRTGRLGATYALWLTGCSAGVEAKEIIAATARCI